MATLDKLCKKIGKDPRHKNSRILYSEPAKFVMFTRWSMNVRNFGDRQADKYGELVEVIEAAKGGRKIGAASPAARLLPIFKI